MVEDEISLLIRFARIKSVTLFKDQERVSPYCDCCTWSTQSCIDKHTLIKKHNFASQFPQKWKIRTYQTELLSPMYSYILAKGFSSIIKNGATSSRESLLTKWNVHESGLIMLQQWAAYTRMEITKKAIANRKLKRPIYLKINPSKDIDQIDH